MRNKILWITKTAVMLAALIALQAMTKPYGQFVTGSCVNAVLAVTVLMVGMSGGLTVALISPILAWMFDIAPALVTVPVIMLANACYVALLHLFLGKSIKPVWKQPIALCLASAAKFGVLYLLVLKVICGVAADHLMGKLLFGNVLLNQGLLPQLLKAFTWPQLVTALIGGAVAIILVPLVRKALHE